MPAEWRVEAIQVARFNKRCHVSNADCVQVGLDVQGVRYVTNVSEAWNEAASL